MLTFALSCVDCTKQSYNIAESFGEGEPRFHYIKSYNPCIRVSLTRQLIINVYKIKFLTNAAKNINDNKY